MSCDANTELIQKISEQLEEALKSKNLNDLRFIINIIFETEAGEIFLMDSYDDNNMKISLRSLRDNFRMIEYNIKSLLNEK